MNTERTAQLFSPLYIFRQITGWILKLRSLVYLYCAFLPTNILNEKHCQTKTKRTCSEVDRKTACIKNSGNKGSSFTCRLNNAEFVRHGADFCHTNTSKHFRLDEKHTKPQFQSCNAIPTTYYTADLPMFKTKLVPTCWVFLPCERFVWKLSVVFRVR